jgi:hypothetical protein
MRKVNSFLERYGVAPSHIETAEMTDSEYFASTICSILHRHNLHSTIIVRAAKPSAIREGLDSPSEGKFASDCGLFVQQIFAWSNPLGQRQASTEGRKYGETASISDGSPRRGIHPGE